MNRDLIWIEGLYNDITTNMNTYKLFLGSMDNREHKNVIHPLSLLSLTTEYEMRVPH